MVDEVVSSLNPNCIVVWCQEFHEKFDVVAYNGGSERSFPALSDYYWSKF